MEIELKKITVRDLYEDFVDDAEGGVLMAFEEKSC